MLNDKYAKNIKRALCTTALITSIFTQDAFPACNYDDVVDGDKRGISTATLERYKGLPYDIAKLCTITPPHHLNAELTPNNRTVALGEEQHVGNNADAARERLEKWFAEHTDGHTYGKQYIHQTGSIKPGSQTKMFLPFVSFPGRVNRDGPTFFGGIDQVAWLLDHTVTTSPEIEALKKKAGETVVRGDLFAKAERIRDRLVGPRPINTINDQPNAIYSITCALEKIEETVGDFLEEKHLLNNLVEARVALGTARVGQYTKSIKADVNVMQNLFGTKTANTPGFGEVKTLYGKTDMTIFYLNSFRGVCPDATGANGYKKTVTEALEALKAYIDSLSGSTSLSPSTQ